MKFNYHSKKLSKKSNLDSFLAKEQQNYNSVTDNHSNNGFNDKTYHHNEKNLFS